MNLIFSLTIFFVFLPIFVESINLILQLKGKILTSWFGNYAFLLHSIIVITLWIIASIFFILLQFQEYSRFHEDEILVFLGIFLLVFGGSLAILGFSQLGITRSLCLNFFEDNTNSGKNDPEHQVIENFHYHSGVFCSYSKSQEAQDQSSEDQEN